MFAMDSRTSEQTVVGGDGQSDSQSAENTTQTLNSVDSNHKLDHLDDHGLSIELDVRPMQVSVSSDNLEADFQVQGTDTKFAIPIQKKKMMDNLDFNALGSSVLSPALHVNAQKPKKGSFQITRVINRKQHDMDMVDHGNEDADSIGDDFDETNTEDLSSEMVDADISKNTDLDPDASSEDTVQSLVTDDLQKEKALTAAMYEKPKQETTGNTLSTSASFDIEIPQEVKGYVEHVEEDVNLTAPRFKIVKVANERFVRGRWTCMDFQDSIRMTKDKSTEELGSGNSSAASSVHFVPGVDDPSKNPFATAGSVYVDNSSMSGVPADVSGQSMSQSQIQNTGSDYNSQLASGVGSVLPQNTGSSTEMPGAHDLPSSIVQPGQSAKQPISSSQHSQAAGGTYSTPTPSMGGNTSQSSQLSKEFNSDYLSQPTSQSQSIPNPQSSAQTGQDYSANVTSAKNTEQSSVGPSTDVSSTNLADFVSSSGNIGSTAQSSNASPSETIQASDFRGQEGLYIGSSDDQQSTISAEDDRMSEGSTMKVFSTQSGLAMPLQELVMQYNPLHARDEDESGASTVAIDNKIEQAMDLVKSHLMFAVREEVIVLKEQIKELLEKNSQLEYENHVLRQAATQETLAKLTSQPPAAPTPQQPANTPAPAPTQASQSQTQSSQS